MHKTSGPKVNNRGTSPTAPSLPSDRYRQNTVEEQLELPNLVSYPHGIESKKLSEIPVSHRPFAIAAITILVDRDHNIPLEKLHQMGFDQVRLDRAAQELSTLNRHTCDQEDRKITHGRLAQDSSPFEKRRHYQAAQRASSQQAKEVSEKNYPELCALWDLARKDVDIYLGIEAARQERISELRKLKSTF